MPEEVNQVWSTDFMSDALRDGRRFRTFNVIDDFNREALAVEIDIGISVHPVMRILDRIAIWRGLPERISRHRAGTDCFGSGRLGRVVLEFIKPSRPMQNGFIERFNRSYREAVLNMYIFERLEDVKRRPKNGSAFTISIARTNRWEI